MTHFGNRPESISLFASECIFQCGARDRARGDLAGCGSRAATTADQHSHSGLPRRRAIHLLFEALHKLGYPLFKRRFHPRSGTLSLGGPLPVPIEVRPDVGAPGAASPTNKSRFKVGQPSVIRPFVPTDYRRMAAFVIGAVDEQTTNARYSHFSKGDFILATFCGAAAGECGHSR